MSFLEVASDLGPLLLNQMVVSATSCEDVFDLLIIQTRKEYSASVEALLETVQGVDVDFGRDS